MIFYCKIKPNGSLSINRSLFLEAVRSLATDKEEAYVLELKKKKKFRSPVQNNYYWVCVGMIAGRLKDLGHEIGKDEVHEFLKMKFLYFEVVDEKTGEVLKFPKKTSDLSTSEFEEYLSHIKQWSAEILDLYIPDPNEQLEI